MRTASTHACQGERRGRREGAKQRPQVHLHPMNKQGPGTREVPERTERQKDQSDRSHEQAFQGEAGGEALVCGAKVKYCISQEACSGFSIISYRKTQTIFWRVSGDISRFLFSRKKMVA